jgi:hypothetical protein
VSDPTQIYGPLYGQYLDPVKAHWRLHVRLDGRPNDYFRKMEDTSDPDQDAYREKVEAAARYALGLPDFNPLTGEGCLQDQVLTELDLFLEYLNQKKSVPASL